MDLTDQPTDTVPLQGRGYEGLHRESGGPAVVQYTTVNLTTETPKDHIVWSLCCFVYSNICCLGLAALIFSVKARDRKMVGDLDGARHYGSTARCINIVSTVLISIIIFITVIVVIVIIVKTNELTRYSFNNF